MKKPKIQCVCGFGCGSSLMLRMAIDDILKKHELECDSIFISKELAERIKDRADVPVIVIEDFMNSKEVEDKTLDYMNSLQ